MRDLNPDDEPRKFTVIGQTTSHSTNEIRPPLEESLDESTGLLERAQPRIISISKLVLLSTRVDSRAGV